MIGISRADAEACLRAGWSRHALLELQRRLLEGGASARLLRADMPWALLVEGEYLFYRSHTIAEIRAAFEQSSFAWGELEAWCDGSGTSMDKVAGIGGLIRCPGQQPVLISQNIGLATNNFAEIAAIWSILQCVPDLSIPIKIFSDSEYAIGALTLDWARNANGRLIECVRADLSLRKNVKISHVKGHSGIKENEIVDQLAKLGRRWMDPVTILPIWEASKGQREGVRS